MYEDKELQEYRDLLKTPDHFEEGFDWKTIVGAVFIGFLMMPGSMYLQLVIGTGIGPAARWVTIILFAEIAKRSYTELKQQEIFILYFMAGAALASPFQGLLWNQYLVQSDAARMLGLTEFIPSWVAPAPESESLVERTFFHKDWLIPILLLVGTQFIQRIDHFGLGYALFRITSDVEKLPFPMAPVGALGTMALAESTEDKQKSWKWRIFSIGGVIEYLFDGNRNPGPGRLSAAAETGIPQILAPSGLDHLSYGSRPDKEEVIKSRKHFIMDKLRIQVRTTAEELIQAADVIAERLNSAKGPFKFLIPSKGWSSIDMEGRPCYDPDADAAFTKRLKEKLNKKDAIEEMDLHLYTPEFAKKMVDEFVKIFEENQKPK